MLKDRFPCISESVLNCSISIRNTFHECSASHINVIREDINVQTTDTVRFLAGASRVLGAQGICLAPKRTKKKVPCRSFSTCAT